MPTNIFKKCIPQKSHNACKISSSSFGTYDPTQSSFFEMFSYIFSKTKNIKKVRSKMKFFLLRTSNLCRLNLKLKNTFDEKILSTSLALVCALIFAVSC